MYAILIKLLQISGLTKKICCNISTRVRPYLPIMSQCCMQRVFDIGIPVWVPKLTNKKCESKGLKICYVNFSY